MARSKDKIIQDSTDDTLEGIRNGTIPPIPEKIAGETLDHMENSFLLENACRSKETASPFREDFSQGKLLSS